MLSDIGGFLFGGEDNVEKSTRKIGKAVSRGVVEGTSEGLNDKNSVEKPFKDFVKIINDFLGIHSPSRVGMTIGENFGQGFLIGVRNKLTPGPDNKLLGAIGQIVSGLGAEIRGINGGDNPFASGPLVSGRGKGETFYNLPRVR